MAISARCPNPKCKSDCSIKKQRCMKCGTSLTNTKRYTVKVKFPNGKWKTKVAHGLTQARQVEEKFNTQKVEDDVFDKKLNPRFSEVWDQYLEWAKQNKMTWKGDESIWRHRIDESIKTLRMGLITPKQIASNLTRLKNSETKYKKPYSPASIKHTLVLIKRVYNWATKMELYNGNNPATKVESPKFDNTVTTTLTKKELKKLLKELSNDRWTHEARVVKFALFTGKRRGEILQLTWENIDLDKNTVRFPSNITKNGETQFIPINQNAIDVLQEASDARLSELVFPCRTGKFFHSFGRNWQKVRKEVSLEKFRFHDLRHTFASFLASSGEVDLYTLQNLLGHKSTAMTQRYAHLFDDSLRKASNVAMKIV
ncbi:MAG: site-specific integrase [Pseudodesulfovibrio sp.]